jgi:hypothetical protein
MPGKGAPIEDGHGYASSPAILLKSLIPTVPKSTPRLARSWRLILISAGGPPPLRCTSAYIRPRRRWLLLPEAEE